MCIRVEINGEDTPTFGNINLLRGNLRYMEKLNTNPFDNTAIVFDFKEAVKNAIYLSDTYQKDYAVVIDITGNYSVIGARYARANYKHLTIEFETSNGVHR